MLNVIFGIMKTNQFLLNIIKKGDAAVMIFSADVIASGNPVTCWATSPGYTIVRADNKIVSEFSHRKQERRCCRYDIFRRRYCLWQSRNLLGNNTPEFTLLKGDIS